MTNQLSVSLPTGIYEFAWDYYQSTLLTLYYPDLYILPLTQEGEIERERLYQDYDIARYGAYERTLKFRGEMYNVIMVNND